MRKVILASTSPRRIEILQMVGLKFRAVDSTFVEIMNPRLRARGQAEYFSQQKAEAVIPRYKDAVVIGADSVISFQGEVLGKPHTKENAIGMLTKLQGNMHSVITAFTIIDSMSKKTVTKSVETKVFMKKISHEEIVRYVASGEPLDRAGSYAIQGKASIFIEKIEGDYFNVVGLPVASVIEELKRFGITTDV